MKPETSTKQDSRIDPFSVIADGAVIGAGVSIGPFCRIGPDVVIEDNVVLHSHVVIEGITRIGAGTSVQPFTPLGTPPQHKRYAGEPTRLEIGPNCDIREGVSVHRGTAFGGGVTRVGAGTLLMNETHIGHDCTVGDNVVLAAKATLAGHCVIGDNVLIGLVVAVHQFVRIGSRSCIGVSSAVRGDVIPFGMATGAEARLRGLNVVGLKRAGFTRGTIKALRAAYKALFIEPGPPFRERIDPVAERFADIPEVAEIIAFIRGESRRPLTRAARGNDEDE